MLKNKKASVYGVILCVLLTVLFWFCGDPVGPITGGGNESPNAFIKGTTAYKLGAAGDLGGIDVDLYKVEIKTDPFDKRKYFWKRIGSTVTDSAGMFKIARDSVADTTVSEVALVLAKDKFNSFSGYLNHQSPGDSVINDTLLLDKAKLVEGIFIDKLGVSDWKIIDGSDTLYLDPVITIGLVGTYMTCQVRPDSTFTLPYVAASSYKMQILYKMQVRSSEMTVVNYTTFVTDAADIVDYSEDPFIEYGAVAVDNDTIKILHKDYEIKYSVKDQ